VPIYLVESYGAKHGDAFAEARERAQRAAQLGIDVRYVRTTFLPEDETLLHIFEAPSVEALRDAGVLAALAYERIVEALEHGAELERMGPNGKVADVELVHASVEPPHGKERR
jgi:hypothetical protein